MKRSKKVNNEYINKQTARKSDLKVNQGKTKRHFKSAGSSLSGKLWRVVTFVIGVVIILVASAPTMRYGIFNIGVVMLTFLGAIVCLLSLINYKSPFFKRKWVKRVNFVIIVTATAGMILLVGMTAVMIQAGFFEKDTENNEATVIVLGCQVVGQTPSKMLGRRIDAAAAYLKQNPKAKCIVTGGVGDRSEYSEAFVMKKELIKKGIQTERIYLEEQARNTKQNISYSAEIIEKEGLSTHIVLITDPYHQYRAKFFCKLEGFEKINCNSSKAPWYLHQSNWIREYPAILKAWILK